MAMQEIVNANPELRKKLYAGYAIAGTVLGAVEVVFLAIPEETPTWLRAALTVYLFLGTAFGFGARSKVDAEPVEVVEAPLGRVDVLSPETYDVGWTQD